jgi:hypothetical protein
MDTPLKAPGPRQVRAADRRRGNRHRLDVPATLTAAAGGAEQPAVVTAFSVNGVGLRVARPLEVGSVHAVSSFDTLLPPGLTVRVRSQRITPAGDHEVGAEVV